MTRLVPSLITIAAMIVSFSLPGSRCACCRSGTAYTVRTGVGATVAFVVGIVVLGEPARIMRLLAAGLIVSAPCSCNRRRRD